MSDFTPSPKPEPRAKKAPKRPKAKNVKRSADAFIRSYYSEDRVEWVKSLPCIVPGCRKPSENAHVLGPDGMGRKAGYETVAPICGGHHRALHEMGRPEFEGHFYVDLAALALDTERCWRRAAGHAPPQESAP